MEEPHQIDLVRSQKNNENADAQPLRSSVFPLEKLPPELQLEIIAYAMPQNGLRLNRLVRTYDESTPGTCKSYCKLCPEDSVPTGLFRANKYISAMALNIFHNTVCMHISVSPENISVFDRWVPALSLPSRAPANKMQYFTSMRGHRLNLRLEDSRFPRPSRNAVSGKPFYRTISEVKEQVRFVSDLLSENPDVQQLTVTFPCICAIPIMPDAPPVQWITNYYLAPLKRLRVAQPVLFIPAHGPSVQAEEDICDKPECLQLAQQMQSSMGHLKGEDLSYREKTWKDIKAMKRPTGQWTQSEAEHFKCLKRFWLNFEAVDDTDFDILARRTVQRMNKYYHRWQEAPSDGTWLR
ncbi:MAG: hypothetical protein Q9209_007670 [Squamulea sp. 1 TL-2023]